MTNPQFIKMVLSQKLQRWFRYFYEVPWCVPAWGWMEFMATVHCISTAQVVNGPSPAKFAYTVKDFLDVTYALPVNHGRTAIELALRALGVGREDDVILPSYVCRSVLDAVFRAGANAVFADIDTTLHVTVKTVEAALTKQTKCVIVPHLFGNTAPIDEIESTLKNSGIALIDDAAQSFGAKCSGRLIGTFGDCGIVSCGPGKTLAGASGGLLLTNNRKLYEQAAAIPLGQETQRTVIKRTLQFWIWRRFRKYTLPFRILMNSIFSHKEDDLHTPCKMSNLDAAIALQQFDEREHNYQNRYYNAQILMKNLSSMAQYCINDLSKNSTLLKLVMVLPPESGATEQLISSFAHAGIECQQGYSPLHQKSMHRVMSLPFTENLWDRVICIPVETTLKYPQKLSRLVPSNPSGLGTLWFTRL